MDESELRQYHLLFRWVNLLLETKSIVRAYTQEEHEFFASLAHSVWYIWKNKQDNLFRLLHSRCCGFDDFNCKNITVRTEKRVVWMLVRMSNNQAYADEILALGLRARRFKAPSALRMKYVLKASEDVGTEMIQRYLRTALWKDRLGFQVTLLESYLSQRDAIERLGLRTIPNIWTYYHNMKQRVLYCYKRACCRHCLKKNGKLALCRNCRCVYFCQEGHCLSNSREDIYFGHSKEECALLKLN